MNEENTVAEDDYKDTPYAGWDGQKKPVNVIAEMRCALSRPSLCASPTDFGVRVSDTEIDRWSDHVKGLEARVKELEAELDNRNAIERMNQVNPQGDTL